MDKEKQNICLWGYVYQISKQRSIYLCLLNLSVFFNSSALVEALNHIIMEPGINQVQSQTEPSNCYVCPNLTCSIILYIVRAKCCKQKKFPLYWWCIQRWTAPKDHLPGTRSQSQQPKQALYLQGLIKLIELACCGFWTQIRLACYYCVIRVPCYCNSRLLLAASLPLSLSVCQYNTWGMVSYQRCICLTLHFRVIQTVQHIHSLWKFRLLTQADQNHTGIVLPLATCAVSWSSGLV